MVTSMPLIMILPRASTHLNPALIILFGGCCCEDCGSSLDDSDVNVVLFLMQLSVENRRLCSCVTQQGLEDANKLQ